MLSSWNAEVWMLSARKKDGLRSYLLGAVKYFLADEQRARDGDQARGSGVRPIPLEELRAGRADAGWNQPTKSAAERIYERRWALTVLEQALSAIKGRNTAQAGNAALFDSLKQLLHR